MMTDEHKSKQSSSKRPSKIEFLHSLQDMAETAIPVDTYYVAEWHERPKSRPAQVHIVMSLDDIQTGVAIALRLKSKRATSELIAALRKHRDLVWP